MSYRSRTTTQGRNMAGARALWRATGMQDGDFGKPIIAIANSFTQFVPGHAHLHPVGQRVKKIVDDAGGWGVEFNTIAVDDGIAMGHDGMLYSLPSRELIADSVEYMVQAHVADAMICISNCDKITPGMLLAAMRLNVPTIFVSGGPMEAGRSQNLPDDYDRPLDLIDSIAAAGDDSVSDEDLAEIEKNACPTCGSCSGMFTANSMNCLAEAIGLALPGNGTLLATHADRWRLFEEASRRIVTLARRYYVENDESVLPRSIATKGAFENAMSLDIAMGGSTNTILHLLAAAHEAGVDFTVHDIDRLSRQVPTLCKVAPSSAFHLEDVHRAGGILTIMGALDRAGLIDRDTGTVHEPTLGDAIDQNDIRRDTAKQSARERALAAPGGRRTVEGFSQSNRYSELDLDESGCIREVATAYDADGGLAILTGNLAPEGAVVKTAGVPQNVLRFEGIAKVFESQDTTVRAILQNEVPAGTVVIVRYEGPRGGPGMQEMLYPTSYLKAKGLGTQCALVTDGRFSGGSSGLVIGHVSPEAADGGLIGLVEDGDRISIDVAKRSLHLVVEEAELARRRDAMQARGARAWQPAGRERQVSQALQFYALATTSASLGAVRDVTKLRRRS